jgi:polar amino acid transport system substrate-binding protein
MKKVLKMVVAISLILISTAGLYAAGAPETNENGVRTITIASDATWPPMEFINENKELVGFDIDLMNEIAKAAGFNVEIKNTAWDGIFAGLANGQYDAVISSVTITEDRQKVMDFSAPYVNAGQVIVVRVEEESISNPDDLSGKKVGAQQGTTGAIAVGDISGAQLSSYDEIGLAMAALEKGDIDAVIADSPIAADFALQNENYSKSLKIVGEPFTDEYLGIAVNKGNSAVLDLINAGLKEVTDSGKLEELKEKWLY